MFSELIFFSVNIIFVFKTTLGFTDLYISIRKALNKIYILINFKPEDVDRTDPPIKVSTIKYNPKLLGTETVPIPEVDKLLRTLANTDIRSKSLKK
tara:strand:- start:72 stop:359 length:288 start_codon:yes stop_codon:yes gene_type:complete